MPPKANVKLRWTTTPRLGLLALLFMNTGTLCGLVNIPRGTGPPRAPPSATATVIGNGKEIEPKELRGCSIPHLLIAYTRRLDICDSPARKSNRL